MPESSKSPVTRAQWLAAMGKDPSVDGDVGSSPTSGAPGREIGPTGRPRYTPAPPKPQAPPPPPPAAAPPPESPSDQLDETVEGHAVILARAQATMGEIVASVAEAFALPLREAGDRVEAIKLTLLVAAHSGRAFVRRRIFDAATGRIVISRDERNLLMALGRQHLGHTAVGTDSKVRRIVEAAERRALGVSADAVEAPAHEHDAPQIDGEDSI